VLRLTVFVAGFSTVLTGGRISSPSASSPAVHRVSIEVSDVGASLPKLLSIDESGDGGEDQPRMLKIFCDASTSQLLNSDIGSSSRCR
jgi:hypothetical protein